MNVLFIFTFNNSLSWWYKTGLLNRETSYYKELSKKGTNINFLTFGDKNDLDYTNLVSPIKVYPTQKFLKSNLM